MLRVGQRILTVTEPIAAMSMRELVQYRAALLCNWTIIGRELPRYQLKIEDINREIEWRAADSKNKA